MCWFTGNLQKVIMSFYTWALAQAFEEAFEEKV